MLKPFCVHGLKIIENGFSEERLFSKSDIFKEDPFPFMFVLRVSGTWLPGHPVVQVYSGSSLQGFIQGDYIIILLKK